MTFNIVASYGIGDGAVLDERGWSGARCVERPPLFGGASLAPAPMLRHCSIDEMEPLHWLHVVL
jgi:hypothetical protein